MGKVIYSVFGSPGTRKVAVRNFVFNLLVFRDAAYPVIRTNNYNNSVVAHKLSSHPEHAHTFKHLKPSLIFPM